MSVYRRETSSRPLKICCKVSESANISQIIERVYALKKILLIFLEIGHRKN